MKKVVAFIVFIEACSLFAMEDRDVAEVGVDEVPSQVTQVLIENLRTLSFDLLKEVFQRMPLRERVVALNILLIDIEKSKKKKENHPLSANKKDLQRLSDQAYEEIEESRKGDTELLALIGELSSIPDQEVEGKIVALLREGANPNLQLFNGMTPLHVAVLKGRLNVVKALLDAGADPRIKNYTEETALDFARKISAGEGIISLLETSVN